MTLRYTWTEGSIPPPGHYVRGVSFDGVAGRAWIRAGYGSAPVYHGTFALRAGARDALRAVLDDAGLWGAWARSETRRIGGSHWQLTVTDGDREATVHSDAHGPDDQRPAALAEAVEAAVPAALWADLRARRAAFVASR